MDDLFDLESFGVGLLGEADSPGGSGLLDEAVRVALGGEGEDTGGGGREQDLEQVRQPQHQL